MDRGARDTIVFTALLVIVGVATADRLTKDWPQQVLKKSHMSAAQTTASNNPVHNTLLRTLPNLHWPPDIDSHRQAMKET
ncbi:hypothetical protein RRG08_041951 [Elysia crispata]|uniref:Uncharacterized protein n=1 Tax=Elysia crispata TaxID=231223 RepID=A0AAE1CNY1_9GAST|nr:hypothetical protein RRG08_041951 [Elysia crispata]